LLLTLEQTFLPSPRFCMCLAAALLSILVSVFGFAQAGTVEQIGPLVDSTVPQSIRQSLNAQGYRVTAEVPGSAVEIWYREEVPAQPKAASADAVYERLAPSALVGVLRFKRVSADYRGQSIAAGFYTLRAALMPADGNHMGVAPSRDFLLLIPAKIDPGLQAAPKFSDLVALSRQASGTKHPAPLSLVSAEGALAPSVTKDDEGHVIFIAPIRLSSGEDVPFALVVKGTAPQ
jgi:hypothetical protein